MKKSSINGRLKLTSNLVISIMIICLMIALSVRFLKNESSTAPETEQVVQQEQEIVLEATEVVVEAVSDVVTNSNIVAVTETNNILVLDFESFNLGPR